MKNLILAAMMILSLPAFAEGVSVRGGANSVGDQLYDDYENEGVRELSPKQVYAIVKPLFLKIEKKIPGGSPQSWSVDYHSEYGPSDYDSFLEKLAYGLSRIKWYLDPKPLSQKGRCQNQTVLSVQKVVRACQSDLSVRIDRAFFEGNPDVQAPLVLHELLTWLKLNYYTGITDEGIREASRALRNDDLPQSELSDTLKRIGFGWYNTAEEIRATEKQEKAFAAACKKDPQYNCQCPGYQRSGIWLPGLGTIGASEKDNGWGCH